jgi:ketosteroid isomerase-like protein
MPSVLQKKTAVTPEQRVIAFAAAINAGDPQAASNCFVKDAVLLTPDSTAVNGRERVRSILLQLVSRQIRIEVQARTVLVAGEVALGSERWRVRSAGTEGTIFEQTTSPKWVLSYVEEDWKLAIAAPWGLL